MRHIVMVGFILFFALANNSCNAQDTVDKSAHKQVSSMVEVYYFHFTRRCNTCMSVEENARKAVETLYAEKIKKGEYSFKALNLDDASSKEIAQRLGIGGQTLLVACGNNKIDITDKGFMNAHDLEKMKDIIKGTVERIVAQ